ncbi:hypothetical protein B0T20DRAFT_494772 [Sordaria brevicollis]|uniref:BHLH domain-containing protein n=1 Tax=Sordaria brevicollis TaxID=83679 RepID=A0AAE0PJP6_SORBR|nr:hypothetical protein B0T20DRAFT_494772 [Sordaria brevicollis]
MMDPDDSPATKRRRIEATSPLALTTSAESQHQYQGQHHHQHQNLNDLSAKTDAKTVFEPPSPSGGTRGGTSSGDFHFTAASQVTPVITITSPIRFEDFLTQTTGETPRPDTSVEGLEPNATKEAEEEDVSIRERHNNIGRRYRNKLNEQFENLQALLSQQQQDSGAEDDDNEYGESHAPEDEHNSTARDSSSSPTQVRKRRKGRGTNKARLLEMAKVRIETLTEQREMLIAEVKRLEKELAEEGAKSGASASGSGDYHGMDETY